MVLSACPSTSMPWWGGRMRVCRQADVCLSVHSPVSLRACCLSILWCLWCACQHRHVCAVQYTRRQLACSLSRLTPSLCPLHVCLQGVLWWLDLWVDVRVPPAVQPHIHGQLCLADGWRGVGVGLQQHIAAARVQWCGSLEMVCHQCLHHTLKSSVYQMSHGRHASLMHLLHCHCPYDVNVKGALSHLHARNLMLCTWLARVISVICPDAPLSIKDTASRCLPCASPRSVSYML